MAKVFWTPRAERDLEEIAHYIGVEKRNPGAARRWLERVIAKTIRYSEHPGMGIPRPDLAADVRCYRIGDYVVIYRVAEEAMQVLMVTHGARDIPAAFRRIMGISETGNGKSS